MMEQILDITICCVGGYTLWIERATDEGTDEHNKKINEGDWIMTDASSMGGVTIRVADANLDDPSEVARLFFERASKALASQG